MPKLFGDFRVEAVEGYDYQRSWMFSKSDGMYHTRWDSYDNRFHIDVIDKWGNAATQNPDKIAVNQLSAIKQIT